ncbi:hypothetical protein CI109_104531 [Kwoniella shandongensis]|uniref:Uncharacterized protein n=1 Tax=Kwoniella shandongensis TaxID=1734106 RepID=A0A5M6BTU5_9TREE|nr:uncharacterized protein CI109_005578 [Kwoniella shandongensis]KAA5526143.1 hypothetical protein CI109_005578 [Kwoniella shandongensis]
MATSTAITLAGATGLTGSFSLKSILTSPHPFDLTVLARRAVAETPGATNKLTTRLYDDLFEAPKGEQNIAKPGGVYVSCLGTTRAKAGGTAQQEKIDLDLNRDLAARARKDGAETAILVSSSGANATSYSFYLKIKGQLEEDIKGMGFSHVVILRPGFLLGQRPEKRVIEGAAQSVFRFLGKFSSEAYDVGDAIAQLAAHPPAEKVTVLYDAEIAAYGKQYRDSKAQSGSK